jgi:hypothetical protein
MRLSRRTLLVGGGAVAAVTGLVGGAVVAKNVDPAESLIRAVLRDRFPDIQVTEDDLSRFAGDYLTHKVAQEEIWLLRVAGSMPGISLSDQLRGRLPSHMRDKLAAFENSVMNMFLLSTDFFLRGLEAGPVVSYVAYADPLVNPCMNPLARFDA